MIFMKCPRCGIEQINFDESETTMFPRLLNENYEFHKIFKKMKMCRSICLNY